MLVPFVRHHSTAQAGKCLNAEPPPKKGQANMTIMMEKAAPVVEMKECFNCADVHDVEEMSHCLICNDHACMYCSCNCAPITE